MPTSQSLPRQFFSRLALQVARELLGTRLVRLEDGQRLSGIIVEVEAYRGEEDLGCHAKAGHTPRTQVMYGPPGHAYVYFTYGMHWMLNFVVEEEGFPAALLIRAILPTEGIEVIAARRGRLSRANERRMSPFDIRLQWTNGPAKLCQALNIDRKFNGADLCDPAAKLFVEQGELIPNDCVTIGPRVGLNNVPEPWRSIPWRFTVRDWR